MMHDTVPLGRYPWARNTGDREDDHVTTEDTDARLREQLSSTILQNKHLENQIVDLAIELTEVKKALAQSAKRENAAREVFVRIHEKGKQLAIKAIELDRKELALEVASKRHDAEQKQSDQQKIEDERVTAKERLAQDCTAAQMQHADESAAAPTDKNEKISSKNNAGGSAGSNVTYFLAGRSEENFQLMSTPSDTETIDATDEDTTLQRIRDYYSGWLDCARATQHEKMLGTATGRRKECAAYVLDPSHAKNPRCAGYSTGANIGWSILCAKYKKPEWDAGRDNRCWSEDDLVPPLPGEPSSYWEGVKYGRRIAGRHGLTACKSDVGYA